MNKTTKMIPIVDEIYEFGHVRFLNLIRVKDWIYMNQYGEIYSNVFLQRLAFNIPDDIEEAYVYDSNPYYRTDAVFMDKDSYITSKEVGVEMVDYNGNVIDESDIIENAIIVDGELMGVDEESGVLYSEHDIISNGGSITNKILRYVVGSDSMFIQTYIVVDGVIKIRVLYKEKEND